jgi:hypothetical protein
MVSAIVGQVMDGRWSGIGVRHISVKSLIWGLSPAWCHTILPLVQSKNRCFRLSLAVEHSGQKGVPRMFLWCMFCLVFSLTRWRSQPKIFTFPGARDSQGCLHELRCYSPTPCDSTCNYTPFFVLGTVNTDHWSAWKYFQVEGISLSPSNHPESTIHNHLILFG